MKNLNIGMIGYGFMARAHSNAYRKVNNFFDLAYRPVLKAVCGRDKAQATAFAVAGVKPPACLIPEAEVSLGDIGYAPYRTPGTPEIANVVGECGRDHQCVIMENHGIIVWGKDVEDAYWKMENVDSYCKTVWVATQLAGGNLHFQPDFRRHREPGSGLLIHHVRQYIADPRAGYAEIHRGGFQRPQRHPVGDRLRRILHEGHPAALLDGG